MKTAPQRKATNQPAGEPIDVARRLEAISDRSHQHQHAVRGLANFLFSAAGDEAGAPSQDVLLGYGYLALILAEEGQRIDAAVEQLEHDVRRTNATTGGVR